MILNAQIQNTDQIWDALAIKYRTGQISDSMYLKQVDSLVNFYYSDINFKEKMTLYHDIIWSNPKLKEHRQLFFRHLAISAGTKNRDGMDIYYLEKAEQEEKNNANYAPTLSVDRALARFYYLTGNNNKCIAIYDADSVYIKSLPKQIRNAKNYRNLIYYNALSILVLTSATSVNIKDTNKVNEMVSLGKYFLDSLRKYKPNDRYYFFHEVQFCKIRFQQAFDLLHDKKKAHDVLLDMEDVVARYNKRKRDLIPQNMATNFILSYWFNYYIFIHRIDSAQSILNKLKSAQLIANNGSDQTNLLLFKGQLQAERKNYRLAYETALKAIALQDSLNKLRIADVKENLYAQLEAEDNQNALEKMQAKKRKSEFWIAMVSLLVLLIGLFTYLFIRKKNRKVRQQVAELNTAAQLQIAELEGRNRMIQKEEQRRMAMELHDNFASNLAGLSRQIEIESIGQTHGQALHQRLQLIRNGLNELYETARDRSHDWYKLSSDGYDNTFSHRISLILEKILPPDKYKLILEIDDESLSKVTLAIKISLLRVLQEAFTNILKHAKAYNIKVNMYVDEGELSMQINDDGKGMSTSLVSKHMGMGLSSINLRVKEINGNILFKSTENGTEILITVPLNSEK